MVGAILGLAAAAAAAAIAFAGHLIGTSTAANGTVSPFGGSVAVHVAHAGRFEVDLEGAASPSGLRRVRCATVSATVACFVGR